MALAEVLTAVRRLILDVDDISESIEERRSSYRSMFPSLSELEIEDLAKILPSQVKTYTSCIYSGEHSTLKAHFPMTFKMLEACWNAIYGENFDGFALTRNLHRARPWKGNTTDFLAQNLVNYLRLDLKKLSEQAPWISEVALLELLSLRIRRANEERKKAKAITVDELKIKTVEELLALSVTIPEPTCFQAFDFEVVSAFTEFRDTGDVSASLNARHTFAVGSRTEENYLRWQIIPRSVFNFLNGEGRRTPILVSAIAEIVAADAPPEQSETEVFSGFFALLVGLMENRAVELHA